MPVKKSSLGRGLNALLGADSTTAADQVTNVLPIDQIDPNPFQPRTTFDEQEIASLVESIQANGVLTPILVRSAEGGRYQIVAGERRWRASQVVGLMEIPVYIRDVDDALALEMAIVENEQRDNLTAVESARAYKRLIEEFSYSQQDVATRIGISRTHVSNLLRLLQLPLAIQGLVENRKLDMGQARALIGLVEAEALRIADLAMKDGWSTRKVEEEVKKIGKPSVAKSTVEMDASVVALSDELAKLLSLPVNIKQSKRGFGMVQIEFSSKKELEFVTKLLRNKI
ncbi:MAG: ParB/RepB/Spo0J family partition protein [Zetaproteobacteria bacterium]|nr:ParB/RepB/Spo0J family partition protein [Zetaproteobacteria bacterium]